MFKNGIIDKFFIWIRKKKDCEDVVKCLRVLYWKVCLEYVMKYKVIWGFYVYGIRLWLW